MQICLERLPVGRRQGAGIILALTALVLLAACAQGPVAEEIEAQAKAACAARGFTPGTADFAACMNPAEATTLQRAAEGWQQMQE